MSAAPAPEGSTAKPPSTRGPWVRDGDGWRCTLRYPGAEDHVYDLEYRRAEPGFPAGHYLFGPGVDGKRLAAPDMEMARFEAFALIAVRCPLPAGALELLVTGRSAADGDGHG